MIEWEILEVVRRPDNSRDALIESFEWVGHGTELEMKRSVAVRGYVRRCQVNAGSLVAFTILTHIITEEEKS